ncbi:UvrD-helicase domain-containing protein [Brachybacterium saurashtrense]|uniref:DNA 3'-5' helicase n=1 Tax=Brachybacterium saurashtrense TaxID=556288 RepID=A0A345YJY2_9MICO|nr:UvrD-helicase domain-containing protein [Brachybacterium saurashtrense]AXK44234.1 exonuclease V subunit beta [Brachybacterium saurashtrense]RRR21506.1 exonuclease V subunit beta [Brachybacterium saurashtrense]
MTFTLINASAGSGKTYALTQRLAALIGGGLDPSEVIATTFTVKAAEELTARVRSTLLDGAQVTQARGIDSAVIGTVNSVAGRLVTDYAMDAGLSPAVDVLDETTQKAAFGAAIARTAAARGEEHSDLLARTEHDGDEDDTSFRRRPSWRGQVRTIANAARTNLLDAAQLRAASETSWESFREDAALPAPGPDLRPRWLHLLDQRLEELGAALAASRTADEQPIAGGPISARSLNRTAKDLEDLQRLRRTLADHDRAPWSAWRRIAAGTMGAVAKRTLAPLSEEIAAQFTACGPWQEDVRALIALVLGTAAESLDAYEQHKRDLGMIDFIDQEVRALRLLQESPRVRASVASRFRLLAVDEFQDTSPVQLALFLELSRLIEDKIWVGDPKQAIYGFRDADPRLMQKVIAALGRGDTVFGTGEIRDLTHSWRSREQLVEFTNALFTRVFDPDGTGAEQITLAIPAQRQERAAGGTLEVWEATKGDNRAVSAEKHAAMIAEQIRERIAEGAFTPGSTAVLVRTHTQRQAVVAALQARGVPTAGAAHALLSTREAQMVRAALAVTLDATDTLALTELVTLLEDHAAHRTWFEQLMAAPDREARRAVYARWWEDETLQGLHAVRRACIAYTPEEMLSALIDALDLPQRIKRWSGQGARRRSLDALRALARETTARRRAEGAPITLTALRAELDAWEEGPDLSGLPEAVWVGTIHAAKGLEWDHVVTHLSARAKERDQRWGVLVRSPEEIDVTAPLAGRDLQFRPELAVPEEVAALLEDSAFTRRRAEAEAEEAGRLQYVALTRAASTAVLAVGGARSELDALIDGDDALLTWGEGALRVDGAAAPLPARLTAVDVDALMEQDVVSLPAVPDPLAATDVPLRPEGEGPVQRAARFQASGVASDEALGTVHAPRTIGRRLVTGGGPQWERVGEAIHAYLALPLDALTEEQREAAAARLVQRWTVSRTVEPTVLVEAGTAWASFLAEEFPGAELLTEQPLTWWNEEDQVMEGWIDTLLRLPGGEIVLVDHKSYPGEHPVEHVREHYLGQLATYSRALAASGLAPSRILLHLPLRGEVVEVTLHG